MSQVVAMARRLQEAERTIAELRQGVSLPLRPDTNTLLDFQPVPSPPVISSPEASIHTSASTVHVATAPRTVPSIPNTRQVFVQSQPALNAPATRSGAKEDITAELSVDEHGKICYYGPTSAVHDPPEADSPVSVKPTSTEHSTRAEMSSYLATYAKDSMKWEDFALRNAALETGIPHQVMAKLLHLHWTWVAPMFMWTYRPAFVRTSPPRDLPLV